ncbi:MAG: hypothetical protein EPO07_03840 [Verrucomicrobia bacterium]|nr:MAG: hypothetical protein EPO07_03840 [Verrucomicrobiota bacterium]
MPDRARVTSSEALETFRAKLIIYRGKASRVLDEVGDDVTRTRLWLQTDRPAHWAGEIRRRTRTLEEKQQELFSARLSGLAEASYVQQDAVRKARESLRDAEERLHLVQRWSRQYDQRVEPLARHVEKLRQILDKDLPMAVAHLVEIKKTLEAYSELPPTPPTSTPPQP